MITIGAGIDTRLGADEQGEDAMLCHPPDAPQVRAPHREVRVLLGRTARWMIQGYQRANATDLASAVAFQALVAVVPMFLLLISIAGLFLQDGRVLQQAILAIAWILPSSASGDAFTAAFEARRNSGLFGALSLLGFAWIGTGFVSAMARSMNRIYGVPNAGYIKEKQRGFIVILLFALFFLIASATLIVTTFFVGNTDSLPLFLQQWRLTEGQYQVISYAVAALAALALFVTIYRLVPNARQRMPDVWPGVVVSAVLFLAVVLAFPIYLRLVGGGNRYGVALGLLTLMVVAFYAFAHVILFGAYINATWQRHREEVARRRAGKHLEEDMVVYPHSRFVPRDSQAERTGVPDQVIR